jgi:hypothetical protein
VNLEISGILDRGRRAQRNWRLDEIVPLCAAASAADPELMAQMERCRAPEAGPPRPEIVTVVIPTHRRQPRGIQALLDQDMGVNIIVLSNGAGPDRVPGAEVRRVEWRGHGPTRAAVLDAIETEFVFFTVDDAIPLGRGFLRTMVEGLESGAWDAAVARQVPWPDADAVTASRLRRWTPPGDRVIQMPQADHVATLYRTETLRKFPLPAVPIAEDAWWSRERSVAYVPMAPILHSHAREPGALFRRNRDIHQQLVAMGREPTVPSFGALLGAVSGVIRPTLSSGPMELVNQVAELAGQWRGSVTPK